MLIIDQLPPEILSLILSSLDISDLLRCRLVNRRWKATIEFNVRIKGLTVREHEFSDPQYFEFSDQLMKRNHQFITVSKNFAQDQFMQTILKNLRKFAIDILNLAIVHSLDGLTSLEHLEVYELALEALFTIKSTNLKTLAVNSINFNGEGYLFKGNSLPKQLRLDTPNLSTVEFGWDYCFEALEFVYPRSVTTFSAYLYQEDFRQFENLRVCYIHDFGCIDDMFPTDFLKLFPALHLFHCKWTSKDFVSNLLSSKDRLKRTDFKFYLRGLQIKKIEKLEKVCPNDRFARNKHFKLLLAKYHQLPSAVPYNRSMNYTVLNRHFNGRIDRGFFDRFKNILRLLVTKPIGDQEQFAWFVRNCGQLQELTIEKAGADQSLYDQLPDYCPRISKLQLNEKQELNLRFALRLKNLHDFKLQDVPFSFARSAVCLLKKLKYKVKIGFTYKGQLGQIFLSDVVFNFKISGETLDFDSRDKLIQHIKSIGSSTGDCENSKV